LDARLRIPAAGSAFILLDGSSKDTSMTLLVLAHCGQA
jgi:hypothetical protein